LRIALLEQMKSNKPVGKLLVSLGFISEATLREALSENLGQQSVDLAQVIIDPEALKLIPREFAKRHNLFPLAFDNARKKLIIAIADPNNIVAIDQVRGLLHGEIELETRLAGESEIARTIDQVYGHELSIDGILNEIETGQIDYRSLQATSDEYSQPVVRLIAALLADAVQRGASDIHFEPEQNFLRIRYRVDGMLRQIRSLHRTYWPAMAVRIKVMSKMNIAETRAPQDGRISLTLAGRSVDFRVSAHPTSHGENIVLRILDRLKGIVPLEGLGLDDTQLDMLKLMIARPEGIILTTGPTGSGKTTTLYSILNHINSEGVNIMTLEDPVEYPMNLIRQSSVADSAKLDFANGIRSMMRQDPDIILVGEIRDQDTAVMAFRAAMTGHQVYSTLHTNSAVGAIPRLLDIGIVPDILAGNIIGIIAQRLIRKLCPDCRQAYQAEAHECKLLGIKPGPDAPTLYRAVGCDKCDYQGYRGRLAIMELLKLDSDLDELIARRATLREIRSAAIMRGFRTLVDDGLRRVLDHSTSFDEAARVVDLTERLG
jgi:general secretion pathway protein E/type IV pilus assembly protein PilB